MTETTGCTDRELLEQIHRSQAVHEATHIEQDKLITKMASAIWGNGNVGLTAKVYLLMGALGGIGTIVTGAAVVVLFR